MIDTSSVSGWDSESSNTAIYQTPVTTAVSLPLSVEQQQIHYKFNEPEILQIMKDYIDNTYSEHYVGSKSKIQTVEYIYDTLGNTDFMRANILKYASRLDKKDGEEPKKDVKKLIHYAIMMYYYEFMQGNS